MIFLYIFVSIFKSRHGGIGEVVNTLDCGSSMRGFDSHIPPHIDNKTQFIGTEFFILIFNLMEYNISKENIMREIVKEYEIDEKATIDKLLECGFKEGGFLTKFECEKKYRYYKFLTDDFELHIEIGLDCDGKLVFDNFDSVIVLDDDFCQPYYPFYDETQDFKMVNLVIRKYNEAMDELVSLGILNEKEPQTREIEPRRRRDKRR